MGISLRALLIQKMSIKGMTENPIKVQPMELFRISRAMPPMRRAKRIMKFKIRIGGL